MSAVVFEPEVVETTPRAYIHPDTDLRHVRAYSLRLPLEVRSMSNVEVVHDTRIAIDRVLVVIDGALEGPRRRARAE